jgi:hypothetical protein
MDLGEFGEFVDEAASGVFSLPRAHGLKSWAGIQVGPIQSKRFFYLYFFNSFCKNIRPFQNLSVLATNRRGAAPRRLESSSHGGKANRRGPRKAAHAAAVGHNGWLVFLNFCK